MSQQPADADRPTDEQILQYEAAIKETEVVVHPLVGRAEPLADLKPEYQEGNPTFCVKIDGLCADYDRFRRCRGDGNCFYRAYAFRLFEYLLLQPAERVQVIADIYRTEHKSTLLTAGFEEFAFVDFYDEFFDLLSSLNDLPGYMLRHDIELASAAGGADPSATERLLAIFRNDIISNSVVVHLRFLASAYLKSNADMYSPFLDDGMTMEIFCAQFVEAMDREADQIHLIALAQAMHTGLTVAYLDAAASSSQATIHRFGEDAQDSNELYPTADDMCLLYRPGHYDILYRKQRN